jgi:biopolymer transport protein ExbD
MWNEYGLLRGRGAPARVDISPLLDMVFILLIFFVITTNFSRQTGVDVQKPKAQTALYQGQKTVLVGISREGTLHVHGRQVTPEALVRILARELERRPDASVIIVGDRRAGLGRAVEVMDACALAGVRKVSVAADNDSRAE